MEKINSINFQFRSGEQFKKFFSCLVFSRQVIFYKIKVNLSIFIKCNYDLIFSVERLLQS